MSKLSALESFLIEASNNDMKHQYVVSKRLSEYPFTLKPLTIGEYREVRRRAVNPNAAGSDRVDAVELTKQVIISGCIEPDFRGEEMIKKKGCSTPSELVDKVLLAGEATRLSDEILRISGFTNDVESAREEAKNS
jgi:hypothetical protein